VSAEKRRGRPRGIAIDSDAVRAARVRRCFTQIDLAEAAGLSPRTISAVEAGDPVALRTVRAIASALDVGLDRLLHREASDR
jgi:transcriptional regulator with XRE-family HTH domain